MKDEYELRVMEEERKLLRIFIAIEMPDEVIAEVARVQEVLSGQKFTGKMTELENLHVTLKFLGEIDEKKMEEVRELLQSVKFEAFEARLMRAGTFSIRGMPHIVWIKIGGKGIFELQKKIDAALEGLFTREIRFMSHLTIARVKYVADKGRFKEYVRNIGVNGVHFSLKEFCLKKSELKPLGPVYYEIEKYAADQ